MIGSIPNALLKSSLQNFKPRTPVGSLRNLKGSFHIFSSFHIFAGFQNVSDSSTLCVATWLFCGKQIVKSYAMSPFACLVLASSFWSAWGGLPDLAADTTCSVAEEQWLVCRIAWEWLGSFGIVRICRGCLGLIGIACLWLFMFVWDFYGFFTYIYNYIYIFVKNCEKCLSPFSYRLPGNDFSCLQNRNMKNIQEFGD